MKKPAELISTAFEHYQADRLKQAEAICKKLLGHPDAMHLLGMIYCKAKKHDIAVDYFQKAIRINASNPSFHSNLGIACLALGKLEEAVGCFRKAIGLDPNFAEFHGNLGEALSRQGKMEPAIEHLRKALALNPDFAEAHVQLGSALWHREERNQAVAHYQKALAIKPHLVAAHNNLGGVLMEQGRIDEAVGHYRIALALVPDFAVIFHSLLFAMHHSTLYDPDELFMENLRFAERFEKPLIPSWRPHANSRDAEKRLKIGYVSADFRDHSVTYFIEPILANHDKEQVEVFCYYNHSSNDSHTDRIASIADHWLVCDKLSDDQLADRIRSDGIDVLVDLSGHTALNRLLAFARKPAPVQVTWIGVPITTGLSAMDYRLTDEYMDPPSMTERYHTEKLVRLPSGAAYEPPTGSPPVNALPALTSRVLTLACLNNPVKINPNVVHLWARILTALPNARLMLAKVDDNTTRQRLIDMFSQHGIASDRLVLHPKMPMQDYLALHHQIDLALDPFPFNGGTTTSHSLWMGVPVVTLVGANALSRVGVSLMMRAGLPEFITNSADEYVERALGLARDLPGLDRIRQTLRDRIRANLDNDSSLFTRKLESAFRDMWRTWCATAGA